ncbi:unnamed protein product [Miscanthus lutarioriparius]|uniref:Uncharacterized protein n=1 Tax=Miscanthus lutarioriparius TaxID=422564 RepID=A0A811RH69_9POAL|nr:unnamed protein product [Miscanthus lutarioriparius]
MSSLLVPNLLPELQIAKYVNIVEEDDEIFFRSSIQNISNLKHIQMDAEFVESDSAESVSDVTLWPKDSCLSEQPMKDSLKDIPSAQRSPVCPDFYPLEHDDWENYIIWDNSPATESQPCLKGCAIYEESMDTHNLDHAKDYGHVSQYCAVKGKINGHGSPVIIDPFGFTEMPAANHHAPEKSYYPLTKETPQDNNALYHTQPVTMQWLNNLCLLNRELLEGSWWDYIIWDPSVDTPKPKLIFDLKDDQMLFETVDGKKVDRIHSHAPTMIAVSSSMKSSASSADNFSNQSISLSDQFNISNDKFYCMGKLSQQVNFLAKKGASMCIKVVHSAPAQKLQTMKPKLSKYEPTLPFPLRIFYCIHKSQ